jgi:hypothetical protein
MLFNFAIINNNALLKLKANLRQCVECNINNLSPEIGDLSVYYL